MKYDRFEGKRETDSMVEYVLKKLSPDMIVIDKNNLNILFADSDENNFISNEFVPKQSPNLWWLLVFCYENKGLKIT